MPNPNCRSMRWGEHVAKVWNQQNKAEPVTHVTVSRGEYPMLHTAGYAIPVYNAVHLLKDIPPVPPKPPRAVSDCPKQVRKRERYASDPSYRLRYVTAKSMRKGLKGLSTGSVRDLPYTFAELRDHLERQFRKGMSWENYGTSWQIDHYYPVSAFDLTDPVQFQKCWALVNLRPLESDKNLRKHAVVPDGFEEYLHAP